MSVIFRIHLAYCFSQRSHQHVYELVTLESKPHGYSGSADHRVHCDLRAVVVAHRVLYERSHCAHTASHCIVLDHPIFALFERRPMQQCVEQ